ncbi:tetratricopeptide repeat protein [Dongia sp.]|uniref:tetratricopeptide repeat protein n=1 Tax=Dongia sp. TaxID=1977262 RepID=UPI0034A3304B
MKHLLRRAALILALWLPLAGPVAADQFDDALAAANSGDFATALRLWRPLAEQGRADAQFNLGVIYANGQGVPQDYAAAVKWYRLAAEQGDAAAQNNLGLMYAKGQGVPQDYVKAHMWFNLSASSGDKEVSANGTKNRELVAGKMTPADISKAQKLASEWKPKPAAQ